MHETRPTPDIIRRLFPLRLPRWISGMRVKILAGAAILMPAVYMLYFAKPLTGVARSDTPLLWFPDANDTKANLRGERIYNKPNKYLIRPLNVCPSGVPIRYLFIVFSAAQYTQNRTIIRRTWPEEVRKSSSNRLLFIFGKTSTAKLQSTLEAESRQHGDIVQEDFWDTYRNLSLKAVAMLRWATTHCPQARFLVKIDDDSLPNLSNFYSVMHGRTEDAIYGAVRRRSIVHRNRNSKWYISYEEYPRDVSPDFVTGGMYVIGGSVLGPLYRATGHVKPFVMEDMFLTGMCAELAGVPITHLFTAYHPKKSQLCEYRAAVYAHPVTAGETKDLLYAERSLEYKCQRLLLGFYVCYCGTSRRSGG